MNALLRIIRQALAPTRYHRQYACTVERQSDDWATVDLTPDDPKMRGDGCQGVALWHGLPGVEVKVPQGSRVLLGFRDGDPSKPFASLWEPGQVERIRFAGGERGLARVGDPVTVYWPTSMAFVGTTAAGPISGTLTVTTSGVGVIRAASTKVTG